MKDHNPVPEHIEVKLKKQGKIEVDRCAGSYVHFRLNDGEPGSVDPLLYEHLIGDKTVLLTSGEARQIGQKMLDFADHIDKYPDIRMGRSSRKGKNFSSDWPKDPVDGRYLCTPERPKPKDAPKGSFWSHYSLREYECPDCGLDRRKEPPQ